MDLLRVRRLFAGEMVARFGAYGPGGRPRQMPVRFAVIDDGAEGVIACAQGSWPRSISAAALLRTIASNPRVSILADHDGDDPWWLQADAIAEVIKCDSDDPRFDYAARALAERYPGDQGRSLIWATVTSWTGWTAAVAA